MSGALLFLCRYKAPQGIWEKLVIPEGDTHMIQNKPFQKAEGCEFQKRGGKRGMMVGNKNSKGRK